MRSLDKAINNVKRGGMAIPMPFKSWSDKSISVRRGEVSMIAGPPGSGKSTLALAIALRSGVPTLYTSADSHETTMAIRSLAMSTGQTQSLMEDAMVENPEWATKMLEDNVSHIKWNFDASPTLRDLDEELEVYLETQGCYPELVVIDNAVDVSFSDGDEFSSLRTLMKEVKQWARETNAAILVLHHTSESAQGQPCPPRSALHGKISQTPSLVVTISSELQGLMAACAVKNRYGPASPGGSDAVWLNYDPECMQLTDAI
jgi:predicted ATP-dependent serine protease